jgi:hypothetical protein
MSQDRPCKRCIKRNIGHLCHDEPREGHGYHKKSKGEDSETPGQEEISPSKDDYANTTSSLTAPGLVNDAGQSLLQEDTTGLRPTTDDTMVVSNPVSTAQNPGLNGNTQARKYGQILTELPSLTGYRLWI